MKQLAKILGWGLAVFLVLAMIEEREAMEPLLGIERPPPAEVPEADREAAVATVRELLSLMTHLYASSGDPRFAERLPASPEVVREMLDDVVYLKHNLRWQDMSLVELQVTGVEEVGGGRLEVLTREYWVVRTFSTHHREETDPPRSTVVNVKYQLGREARQWRVKGWEHVPTEG